MATRAWILAGAALALVGCFDNLTGTKVKHDLGGGGDVDLSVPGNSDGGNPPGDLAGATVDGGGGTDGGTNPFACELPFLAVLINSNSGSSVSGRIERLPLDGRPKCKALSLAGSLPKDLTAMGFLPPETIAVGGTNIVYQIKQNDKAAAGFWKGNTTYAYGVPIDDLFAIKDGSGNQYLAVAHDGEQFTSTGTQIAYLSIINGDQDVTHWQVDSSGTIKIGWEVRAMTTSALDRTKIFAAKGLTDPYFAAAEFTPPWDDQIVEPKAPYYQQTLGATGEARTIRTLRVSTGSGILRRTAWTFRPGGGSTQYQVYYVNDLEGGAKEMVGPLTCSLPACSTKPSTPLSDAVPDPTNNDAVIAICADATDSSTAHVVRMTSTGDCSMILDGATLLSQEYPGKLTNVILEP